MVFAQAGYANADERRVIFDEDFDWLTPESADVVLARVKRAGFNVFVPAVWHGRGVTWPSALAPKEPAWEKYPHVHDPLGYLIKRAHELDIEVHPWFTVVLRQRDFFTNYFDEGTHEQAFNVHLPAFRAYIGQLIAEVVKKYDVDGVNLDYIRAIGMCVSDFCQRDYKAKYKRELESDIGAIEISESARQAIIDWNGTAVADIVRNVSSMVRKMKPRAIVSVDSHAGSEGWLLQGANSIDWANKGWIDILYHMDYAKLSSVNRTAIQSALARMLAPQKFVLLVGNYEASPSDDSKVWPRAALEVRQLIEYAQRVNALSRNIALYEYRFMTDEQIELLSSGPFAMRSSLTKTRRSK
jgi:uncharacterized lipoprotein YddW (UPF0748 family)